MQSKTLILSVVTCRKCIFFFVKFKLSILGNSFAITLYFFLIWCDFILFLFHGEGWYCWLDLVYVCIITDRKSKCYLTIQNIIFEGRNTWGCWDWNSVMQISHSCFIIPLVSVICLVYKHMQFWFLFNKNWDLSFCSSQIFILVSLWSLINLN